MFGLSRWRYVLMVLSLGGLAWAPPVFADSNYLVLGVIHSKVEAESVALLKDKSTGKTFAARVGQSFARQAVITSIGLRAIKVKIHDRHMTLPVGGDEAPSIASSGTTRLEQQGGVAISGSTVEVSAAYRDHIVRNELAKVLMQAAAIPQFNGGQLRGFKLWDIEPGSVYEQVGFRNGDVVTSINGQDLTDVGSTIRLLHVLKEEESADVSIDRNGISQELNIRIK